MKSKPNAPMATRKVPPPAVARPRAWPWLSPSAMNPAPASRTPAETTWSHALAAFLPHFAAAGKERLCYFKHAAVRSKNGRITTQPTRFETNTVSLSLAIVTRGAASRESRTSRSP